MPSCALALIAFQFLLYHLLKHFASSLQPLVSSPPELSLSILQSSDWPEIKCLLLATKTLQFYVSMGEEAATQYHVLPQEFYVVNNTCLIFWWEIDEIFWLLITCHKNSWNTSNCNIWCKYHGECILLLTWEWS